MGTAGHRENFPIRENFSFRENFPLLKTFPFGPFPIPELERSPPTSKGVVGPRDRRIAHWIWRVAHHPVGVFAMDVPLLIVARGGNVIV